MIELDEVKQRFENWKLGYWNIPDNIDVSSFDLEWRPDPHDKPFIHQFGTQWQKTGGPRFIVPGHDNQVKYQDCQRATRKQISDDRAWRPLLANATIDFSWHPDENDPPYIYVFGNQWYDVDTMPTYQYRVKGATEKKYVYNVSATLLPSKDNWISPEFTEYEFDYSWVPHPHEPPFIWEFGTQWQKNCGPQYVVPGATDRKLSTVQQCKVIKNNTRSWRTLKSNIKFDYTWHPDRDDPPYNYAFGNQWYGPEKMPTVMYRVKGATETKYIHTHTVTLTDNHENFEHILNRKIVFDYSWCPDPDDPPYIYVFGSQHHSAIDLPVLMYKVKNATTVKYVDTIKVTLLADITNWEVPFNIDTTDFDFSWYPSIHEEPAIFQFGTQWQKTGGPRLVYNNGSHVKYIDTMKVSTLAETENRAWRVLKSNISFDYSWHPDESEPPYNYVFGNQWHSAERMPTVIYRVKGATENKYVDTISAKLLDDKTNFESLVDIDFDFDYSWCPDPFDPPYTYVFGNQWHDSKTMPTLMYKMKDATLTKYIDDVKATLKPNKTNWIIPANIDDSNFDYSWIPNPHAPDMIYQFGTQWQKTGGPQYVAGNSYDVKYIDLQQVTKLPEVNKNFRPVLLNIDFDYSWHPDSSDPPYNYVFGNQWHDATVMPTMMYRIKGATENKYVDNTIAKILPNKANWVIPNDIDDSNFDYSWIPNPHEPPMIYQFGTQWQRTSGPRYVVENATEIKYVETQKVTKLPNLRNWRLLEQIHDTFDYSWHPDETEGNYTYVFGNKFHSPEIMPTLMYKSGQSLGNKYAIDLEADLKVSIIEYEDSIFDAVMDNKFDTAYAHFVKNEEPVNHSILATKEVSVHLLGRQAIVPKTSKIYMYDKITDYDHVVNHDLEVKSELLDIIFISNGEACADENLEYLLSLNLPNRIVHINGVQGRVASQHAAANESNTSWYFLINAKLKVNSDFDFSWQPNIYKSRRHYIFTATNPLNGLEYGHQAIVANNKKLTLSTVVRGLDFTMDSRHEVVNVNSGVGLYNSSEWDTYRTAFRECIKLKHNKDVESRKRLDVWLTVANGDFAQYSLQGAKDAVQFYESVNGDLDTLKLSYDWAWIKERFNK